MNSLAAKAGTLDVAGWFRDRAIRGSFDVPSRIKFYVQLGVLVANNVQIIEALETIYEGASDDGLRPNRPQALLIRDVIDSLKRGQGLGNSMAKWVSREEVAIIATGEASHSLKSSFLEINRLLEHRRRITAAALKMSIYPGILFVAVAAILVIVAYLVVPKLELIVSADQWFGFAVVLRKLAYTVTTLGPGILTMLGATAVAVVWALPRYTGEMRNVLDRLPPFSIYRRFNGALFLLGLAVMIRSGIPLQRALNTLAEHANPWLRQRINGALLGTSKGLNLGEALAQSGHDFPDKDTIRFVRTLASKSGFAESLNSYAETQMEEEVKQVESGAKVFAGVAVVIVVLIALLIAAAAFDIQASVDMAIGR